MKGDVVMKQIKRFTSPLVGLALMAAAGATVAILHAAGYRQLATIVVPGNLSGGFDISWADAVAGRYYLTDRGTKSVDVIDTKHLRFLYAIPLTAAGNGVVAIPNPHDDAPDGSDAAGELWVGDSASNVEVFDVRTRAMVASIST